MKRIEADYFMGPLLFSPWNKFILSSQPFIKHLFDRVGGVEAVNAYKLHILVSTIYSKKNFSP